MASITVSRPAARRLRAMKCRTSNASFVAPCSFSSSATRPRQKSDERISVGMKCFRANDDFPDPDGPTRTTRDRFGMEIFMLQPS